MARRKAGIGGDLPSRRKTVGMQDHQWPAGKRIGELANPRRYMPGCTVIGGHPARLVSACQYGADIADPDKAHHAGVTINTRNRQCGPPGRRQRSMDRFDQWNAFFVDVVGKCPRRGVGGVCSMGPVAGPVDKQQGVALTAVHGDPAVPADALAGVSVDDDADLEIAGRSSHSGRGSGPSPRYRYPGRE